VLVIPREHYRDLAAVAADSELLAEIAVQAHQVAVAEGVADTGYRVIFNTGGHASQTVAHVQRARPGRSADVLAAGLRRG
jgi:histidine triad (HIT) family protein